MTDPTSDRLRADPLTFKEIVGFAELASLITPKDDETTERTSRVMVHCPQGCGWSIGTDDTSDYHTWFYLLLQQLYEHQLTAHADPTASPILKEP